MFNNFNLDGCKILKDAEKERKSLKHPYVGSEHLLLSLLKNSTEIRDLFLKHEISYNNFKSELIKIVGSSKKDIDINLYTPLLKRIIANAIEDATETNNGEVLPLHYILAMLEEAEGIAFRMLISMNVDIDALHKDLTKSSKKVNSCLKEIGINLNDTVCLDESILGRNDQIKQMSEIILRKKKNNPILIGEAGVGKTALVEELARRIVLKKVPSFLENKKIVMLEMGSLVAGTKYRGEFEEKLTKIINELIVDENIILFIDEIHTIINAGGAEGAINAADILKPYLARGKIKCIGATTPKEYEKSILKDKALARRFEKVTITEPNNIELEDILMGVKKEYEDYHNIKITLENIKDIIDLSDKYILNKCNPDKSIDLLDTVCAYVKLKTQDSEEDYRVKENIKFIKDKKDKAILNNNFEEAIKLKIQEDHLNDELTRCNSDIFITREDILQIISNKVNLPSKEIQLKNIHRIEKKLKRELIGQEDVIKEIVCNFSEYYQGDFDKPLTLFFQGPTGVGKSMTVKLISEFYEKKYPIININLKEFDSENTMSKLIGTSAGFVGFGEDYILKPLLDNSFALVIIENFESANDKLKQFIKNMTENGKFLNGNGEWINCSNTLFLITAHVDKIQEIGFTKGEFIQNDNIVNLGQTINFKAVTENDVKEFLKRNNIPNTEFLHLIEKSDYKKFGFIKLAKLTKQKIHI